MAKLFISEGEEKKGTTNLEERRLKDAQRKKREHQTTGEEKGIQCTKIARDHELKNARLDKVAN